MFWTFCVPSQTFLPEIFFHNFFFQNKIKCFSTIFTPYSTYFPQRNFNFSMYFYVNVILEAPPTPKSYKYMDWKWDYKIKSEILINSCKIYLAWPSVQLVHSGLWTWWRRSRCFSLTQCCGWLGLHVHCKWPQSYHCLGPRKLLSPEKKTKRFLSRTNLIEDLQMLKKIVRGFLTQFC